MAINIDRELFGLQESVTKLWIVFVSKKGKDEIGKRLSNVLIGTFINAHKLGIKDIESCFDKRLVQLKNELKTNKISLR